MDAAWGAKRCAFLAMLRCHPVTDQCGLRGPAHDENLEAGFASPLSLMQRFGGSAVVGGVFG